MEDNRKSKCPYCGQIFDSNSALDNHYRNDHSTVR